MDQQLCKRICTSSIIDHLQEGLLFIDKDNNITYINSKCMKLLGITKKKSSGNIMEIVSEKNKGFTDLVNQFRKKQKEIKNKKIVYHNRSKELYLKFSLFAPSNKEMDKNSIAILVTDLTMMWNIHVERRKLQTQLKKNYINIMENLRQIANSIAHEIRNPIASIGGYAHLLLSRWKKEDPTLVEKYLQYINTDTRRIDKIINQVEKYTDFDEISFKKANIVKLLNGILQYCIKTSANKDIEVEISDPDLNELMMYLDSTKLKKSLKGVVKLCQLIRQQDTPMKVNLEYRDYDINLTIELYTNTLKEEDHKFLFNPFYSIGTKKVNFDMAFAQRVIIMHGGIIKIIKKSDNGIDMLINLPQEKRIKH